MHQTKIATKHMDNSHTNTELTKLYDEYVDLVYRYTYSRTRNKHIAEDITSTVFFKIIRNWKKYNSQKASVSTWIFTITRNTLTDYFRKSGKIKNYSISEKTEELVDPRNKTHTDNVQIDIDTKRIYQAMDKLSDIEQNLVILRFMEQLSYDEISKKTKININTVGVKLKRAINKLQKILDVK